MSQLFYLRGKESGIFYAVANCPLLIESCFWNINHLPPAARKKSSDRNTDIHCTMSWCLQMNFLNYVDGTCCTWTHIWSMVNAPNYPIQYRGKTPKTLK